ncbi:hypothetical protein [Faecalibaculum rodentium]|jgi:hypothetical protein|uniref:hypothetical protein n=1 Tax=Faecalibaculum rodentium TaxID=1702221 RepID=UPI00255A7244|nr:hypothetical protein [Faecalibaculum rodentium]
MIPEYDFQVLGKYKLRITEDQERKQKMLKNRKELGKVIRILNPTTIVVETSETRLKTGDFVEVYTLGDELKSLDGKSLGRIPIIKDKLQIIQVENGYILCSKYKEQKTIFATSPLLEKKTVTKTDLNINADDIEPLTVSQKDTIVRGDRVRTV